MRNRQCRRLCGPAARLVGRVRFELTDAPRARPCPHLNLDGAGGPSSSIAVSRSPSWDAGVRRTTPLRRHGHTVAQRADLTRSRTGPGSQLHQEQARTRLPPESTGSPDLTLDMGSYPESASVQEIAFTFSHLALRLRKRIV